MIPSKPIADSGLCQSRSRCELCRGASAESKAFRASLARLYVLPQDAPDFACPHGLPFGYTPPPPQTAPQRAAPANGKARPRDLSCVHRGPEREQRQCQTCGGHTMIRVFGCDLHGSCSIERNVGVRTCATCPDLMTPAAKAQ